MNKTTIGFMAIFFLFMAMRTVENYDCPNSSVENYFS